MSSSNERASRNPLYANVQIKEKMDAFRDAAGRVGPALRVVETRANEPRAVEDWYHDRHDRRRGVGPRSGVCAVALSATRCVTDGTRLLTVQNDGQ